MFHMGLGPRRELGVANGKWRGVTLSAQATRGR